MRRVSDLFLLPLDVRGDNAHNNPVITKPQGLGP